MKKILLLTLSACMSLASFGQNYYHIEFTSDITKDYLYSDYSSLGKVIMTKTLNDKYSAKQTIPFDFSFYGTNVNEYLVSDNGYITFNTSATTSSGTKMALPAGGEPNNAIYAFWNDFEMKAAPNASFPVNVYNYTKGEAPNRTHVIQWFGISNQGKSIAANADVFAFALVLHEQGGMFDVINGTYGSSATKGTIGAENADGSVGYAVSGSPNVAFPVASSTNPSDLTVYRFFFGTQADVDAGVATSSLPRMMQAGSPTNPKALVVNYGKNNITSFDLNYTVDGGAVQTTSFTGLNIPAGGSLEVTSDKQWSGTAGSDYAFDIYVSNVNATTDENASNDHYATSVLVNSGTTTTRKVLAEESTGAWCGYCPDGHVTAKTVGEAYPDVIFVKHHISDGMQTNASADFTSTFADGYPDLVIDRTVNASQRSQWASQVIAQRSVGSPATVEILNKSFNETSREIKYDIKVTFVDDFAGDLRIGSIIMEDKVRGPENSQWSQVNYYSKDYPNGVGNTSHVMYEQTSPMIGYYHLHVAAAMPNGAWGEAGVIPEVAFKGSSYTLTVKHTLPAMTTLAPYSKDNNTEWCSTIVTDQYQYGMNKPADIGLIGFVAQHNDFERRNRPILNAAYEKLWNKTASVPTQAIQNDVKIYPNPANHILNVELSKTSSATVQILDVQGRVVVSGAIENGTGSFDLTNLTDGVYIVNVTSGSLVQSSKLMIHK
ncbi:MAG: T9SS type A sorting domain-containing protein [Flavobacteriales bacterium]|nr:T9SS type A sorting domain-containing protein [Flavobacteriales bacterium]